MKRIVLMIVCLTAVAGAWYTSSPSGFRHYGSVAEKTAQLAWESVEASPMPIGIALGTFLLTVVYHKAKGKSLRESVEVAATRVTIVPVASKDADFGETPVVKRAKARATRAQLVADQIGIQSRHRKLPEEILKAEKETCYTQQALADAERVLAIKQKAHQETIAKLDALRKEQLNSESELGEIASELKKLADVI